MDRREQTSKCCLGKIVLKSNTNSTVPAHTPANDNNEKYNIAINHTQAETLGDVGRVTQQSRRGGATDQTVLERDIWGDI
jgi:hypothetical protein